ncbi:hypothetical protein FA15DRAFT_703341 [Coprinopsis marcescibilis]|uniref:Uncharacterized protein n=1 Tax=Coprinopsis marcescibilis TaxID=230819 RepID=A0A5C3KZQ2_COPMA|nr:hypothetical protein FA15DRAFT_703341 [Coprinopsis marcescibilis]
MQPDSKRVLTAADGDSQAADNKLLTSTPLDPTSQLGHFGARVRPSSSSATRTLALETSPSPDTPKKRNRAASDSPNADGMQVDALTSKDGFIESLRDRWTSWKISIEVKVNINNQANVGRQPTKLLPAVASIVMLAAGLAIGVGTARFLRTTALKQATLKQTAVFDYVDKRQRLRRGQVSRTRCPTRPIKPLK